MPTRRLGNHPGLDPVTRGFMKILITGNGVKELALANSFESTGEHEVLVLPGNPGTDKFARETGAALDCITDRNNLIQAAEEFQPDLIVVPDEKDLTKGLADTLRQAGFKVFGPSAANTAFLQNKTLLDEYMKKRSLLSPVRRVFGSRQEAAEWINETESPWVLQDANDSGNFAMAFSHEEAADVLEDLKQKGTEEPMVSLFETGIRFNLPVAAAGGRCIPLQTIIIQRGVYEHEDDPQAKGAGAYCPADEVSMDEYFQAYEGIMKPLIQQMEEDGMNYTGFITGEFVVNERGVVCVNIKPALPDGGTVAVMLRCRSDLAKALDKLMDGVETTLEWSPRHAVAVWLMAKGYPAQGSFGAPVRVDEELEGHVYAHHIADVDGNWYTDGGRVIMTAALGQTQEEAAQAAEQAASCIHSDEALFYRTDIGR